MDAFWIRRANAVCFWFLHCCVFQRLSKSSAFWSCFACIYWDAHPCRVIPFFFLLWSQSNKAVWLFWTSQLRIASLLRWFRVSEYWVICIACKQCPNAGIIWLWVNQTDFLTDVMLTVPVSHLSQISFYSHLRPVSHRFRVFSLAPVLTGCSFHTGNVSRVISHPTVKLIVASYGRDVHLSEFNSKFIPEINFEIWNVKFECWIFIFFNFDILIWM